MYKHFVLLLALIVTASAGAQESIIQNLLKGNVGPATYSVKDLPDDFQALTVNLESDSKSGIAGLLAFSMTAMGGPAQDKKIEYLNAYWTNGTEISDDQGGKYLVAYSGSDLAPGLLARAQRAQFGSSAMASMPEMAPEPPVRLRLVLLREGSMQGLTPRPDLTKAEWLTLLAPVSPNGERPQAATAQVRTMALSNMKQVALASLMYTNDYDDYMPLANDTATAAKVTMPYIKNKSLFKSLNPSGGMVRYNVHLSGVSSSDIERPAETILWYDSLAWPGGTHLVAYVDGHVKFINEQTWAMQRNTLDMRYTKPKLSKATKATKRTSVPSIKAD